MKVWQCYDNLPAQAWWLTDDGRIALEGQGLCLDLTDGSMVPGTIPQTWQCVDGGSGRLHRSGALWFPSLMVVSNGTKHRQHKPGLDDKWRSCAHVHTARPGVDSPDCDGDDRPYRDLVRLSTSFSRQGGICKGRGYGKRILAEAE